MFDNATENVCQDYVYFDSRSNVVRLYYRSYATFNEHFELFRFPFDRQFLNLQMKAKTLSGGWRWLVGAGGSRRLLSAPDPA